MKVEEGPPDEGVVDFLVVLAGESWDSRLVLPQCFAWSSYGRLPTKLQLRHYGGQKQFPVLAVIASADCAFFHRGWKQFVGVHLLEPGWTLRFKWLGEDEFVVFVFDGDGCRRDYVPRLPSQ